MRKSSRMTPPSQIAHYKITGKLGDGGMGAVYRATDTRLNRELAVKILPGAVAADPDRLARFTREAQVLASLKHPNVFPANELDLDSSGCRQTLSVLTQTIPRRLGDLRAIENPSP